MKTNNILKAACPHHQLYQLQERFRPRYLDSIESLRGWQEDLSCGYLRRKVTVAFSIFYFK